MTSLLKIVLVGFLLLATPVVASESLSETISSRIKGFPVFEGLAISYVKLVDINVDVTLLQANNYNLVNEKSLEAEIAGMGKLDEVVSFYKKRLKRLRWQEQASESEHTLTFVKDGEKLTLKFKSGITTLKLKSGDIETAWVSFTVNLDLA